MVRSKQISRVKHWPGEFEDTRLSCKGLGEPTARHHGRNGLSWIRAGPNWSGLHSLQRGTYAPAVLEMASGDTGPGIN